MRGVLVAASVAFALLVARAAKKAGSAEIVGAFATGVVLARTDRRNDITIALKPVVDIFAPLFFVAVGAQVDVALLNPFARENQPALLLALGLTVIGFLGKFAAGFYRVGRSPAGLHRRRDGASRRGRPDLRLSGEGDGSLAGAGLRGRRARGLRDDVSRASSAEGLLPGRRRLRQRKTAHLVTGV